MNEIKTEIIKIDNIYFLSMIDTITEKIQKFMNDHYKFSFITPIGRGGYIPAVYLSHRLDIPICELPIWDSYDIEAHAPTLIVEDIADTGQTLLQWSEKMSPQDKVAALIAKPWTEYMPHFYATQLIQEVQWQWEQPYAKSKKI